jgi:hypothetical protein
MRDQERFGVFLGGNQGRDLPTAGVKGNRVLKKPFSGQATQDPTCFTFKLQQASLTASRPQ